MIIAIDGASTDLSLALAKPDGSLIAEDVWSTAQRQSAELLPRLLSLLIANHSSLHDASVIAVGIGPGSFTGLRVAMSLAKGLAMGLNLPIVGVPSLEAWLEAEPDALAAVARAGAREAYLLEPGGAIPRIVDRDALVGSGTLVAPAELATAFVLADTRRPRGARAISRRAAARVAADPTGDDLATLEPMYVRAPRGVAVDSMERVKWL